MLPTMRAALRPLLLALATTLPLPAAAQQYHAPTPWTGPPATATTTTRASGGRGGSRLGPYFAQDTGWRTAPPTTAVAPVTPAPGPVDVTPPADPAQRWTVVAHPEEPRVWHTVGEAEATAAPPPLAAPAPARPPRRPRAARPRRRR